MAQWAPRVRAAELASARLAVAALRAKPGPLVAPAVVVPSAPLGMVVREERVAAQPAPAARAVAAGRAAWAAVAPVLEAAPVVPVLAE